MLAQTIQDWKALLPAEGRCLGLDVGEKTIGIAMSDVRRVIATPFDTIKRGKWQQDVSAFKDILAKHAIHGLVVGYPINMDGSEGPRCQSTRQFIKNLEKANISLPTLLWDERLSTAAVTRSLLEGDVSRQKRAELVDKMAASYILQGVLDIMGQT